MKNLIYAAAAMAMALSLAACNKSSGSNNVATTPASGLCSSTNGQWIYPNGQACTPGTALNYCSSLGYIYNATTGVWTNSAGQNVTAQCTSNSWAWNTGNGTNACAIYDAQYAAFGAHYYPIVAQNGQLYCVNSQDLQSSMPNYYGSYYNTGYYGQGLTSCTPYSCPQYYGYYYYPNYGGYRYGMDPSSCGSISLSGFSASLCW